MDRLVTFLDAKILPIANKLGSQRHMAAIRKGLIATMPLIIVGSFFTVLLNIPGDTYTNFIAPYREVLDVPFRYTVGIMALYATYGIASNLASSYRMDQMSSGILAVLAFLISSVKPIQIKEDVKNVISAGRYINIANLSAAGLFGAIVSALIAVEIYHFMLERKITIKMPEGVPPEVTNSFVALLPAAVVLLFFWFVRYILGFDINVFLSDLLMPLKGILAGNSLFGGLLTVFLICFFWLLGIHGPAIMGPVIRPFWDMSIAENMEVYQATGSAYHLPNIFTEQFIQWFVWIGGAGATLSLVILMMFSKSDFIKKLGRLSFLPGIFNINEPVIFGAPIVMNPILGIPFIVAPLVMTTLSYFLTITKVVPMMGARLTFSFPSPIAAWMSTNWSISAAILVIVNFVISLVIYYPFFKVYEKQQLDKEAADLAAKAGE